MRKCGSGKTSSNDPPFGQDIQDDQDLNSRDNVFSKFPGACRQKPRKAGSRCDSIGTYGKPSRTRTSQLVLGPQGFPGGLLGDSQIVLSSSESCKSCKSCQTRCGVKKSGIFPRSDSRVTSQIKGAAARSDGGLHSIAAYAVPAANVLLLSPSRNEFARGFISSGAAAGNGS